MQALGDGSTSSNSMMSSGISLVPMRGRSLSQAYTLLMAPN